MGAVRERLQPRGLLVAQPCVLPFRGPSRGQPELQFCHLSLQAGNFGLQEQDAKGQCVWNEAHTEKPEHSLVALGRKSSTLARMVECTVHFQPDDRVAENTYTHGVAIPELAGVLFVLPPQLSAGSVLSPRMFLTMSLMSLTSDTSGTSDMWDMRSPSRNVPLFLGLHVKHTGRPCACGMDA